MIFFRLDTEGGIKIDNLIGDIWITDGNKSIHFQDTYVDSIFETLLTGFIDLKIKSKSSIELIEESGSFDFELIGDGLKLTYSKIELLFDRTSFSNILKFTLDKLLNEIEDLQEIETTPIVDNLMKFAKQLTTKPT